MKINTQRKKKKRERCADIEKYQVGLDKKEKTKRRVENRPGKQEQAQADGETRRNTNKETCVLVKLEVRGR